MSKSFFMLILAMGIFGCSSKAKDPVMERELTVFAASSLVDAMEEIDGLFSQETGAKVNLETGASQELAHQIQEGAPVDVYLSADIAHAETLASSRGLEAVTLLKNELALVVPIGSEKVQSAEDLGKEGVKLVLAASEVPAGELSDQVLAKLPLGVDKNIVSRERNVRAVLAKVALGEADAGFVYKTDARSSNEVREIELPADMRFQTTYGILNLKPKSKLAVSFTEFVLSNDAKEVFADGGFIVPE